MLSVARCRVFFQRHIRSAGGSVATNNRRGPGRSVWSRRISAVVACERAAGHSCLDVGHGRPAVLRAKETRRPSYIRLAATQWRVVNARGTMFRSVCLCFSVCLCVCLSACVVSCLRQTTHTPTYTRIRTPGVKRLSCDLVSSRRRH